jgi:hypothetical protein
MTLLFGTAEWRRDGLSVAEYRLCMVATTVWTVHMYLVRVWV